MRSRLELDGLGDRVHAHRRVAFQDGLAVHPKDDAVVGSCIESQHVRLAARTTHPPSEPGSFGSAGFARR